MELAEKYIYKVYLEKSFSLAAKELYISQSSLSATVKKFENKLGFSVFNRSKTPIELTREGKIFIDYLEEIIENEHTMLNRIKSITRPVYDQISIGCPHIISQLLITKICGEFHKILPNIELKLFIGDANTYNNALERLDSGVLDFLLGYTYDERKYNALPILKERYVVCVKADYPNAEKLKSYALTLEELFSDKDFSEKAISDYSVFENIEFLRINSAAILWQDMSKFLAHCQISPFQIYNCRNIDITHNLMLEGMGATITTDVLLSLYPKQDNLLYLLVNTPKNYRQMNLIYKKDKVFSEINTEFIDTVFKICEKIKNPNK